MAFAIDTYTGNGSTTSYSVTFPYITTADVIVTIDGVVKTLTTDYTFSNSSTIAFGSAPANGEVIKITRSSNRNARLVDYQDGSTLTEASLDQDGNQAFFMAQEAIDITENNLSLSTATDQWDAESKRITNVGNPTSAQDAATKNYLENTWLSPANKTALTTVNANIANINAVNSNEANINSVNSNEANINTVAGQISPTNNISTLSLINSDITDVANNNADISTVAGQISPTNNISTLAGIDTEIQGVYNIRTNVTNVDGNSANINLVSGQISPTNNISTLANLDTELSAVYGIRNNITNVDTNSTNINLVAGQISPTNNINTLGNLNSQLTTLGALGTEITNLNTIRTDISTVAGQISPTNNISTLAGLNTEISGLYNIRTDITAVANISTDIQDVQDKIAELQTVANDLNEATSEIETVAGSINQVDAVGNDLLGANNIGTVATNLSGVNYFGERYRVSATAPTTSLDVGDLYYDTASDTMKVYGSSGWQNAGSSVNGTSQRYNYTATSGQTTFSGSDNNGNTLTYDAGFIDVFLNGSKLLNGTDVTVTSGSSVVLASGATIGDVVDIVAYGTFSVASLNADNLDSGTVPDARISASSVNQHVDLSNLNATNLTSGTVPSARISGAYTGITEVGTLTGLTTNGNINFGDNDKAIFGAGSDLQIYHTGTSSFIKDDGTGNLIIQADEFLVQNTAGTANYIRCQSSDESVQLRFGGATKIQTTSTGIAVTGGVALGGTGTANTLDDYEEGTWTGTIGNGSSNFTMGSKTGSYIKIGSLVFLSGYFTVSNTNSITSGNARLSGLPFANGASNSSYVSVSIAYAGNFTITAGETIGFSLDTSASHLNFREWNSSSGTTSVTMNQFASGTEFMLNFTYRTDV